MPENSICHEIDTGKHYYLANGEWHQLPARGGGEGLPDNFPAEGSANANKFLGFDANGDYTAKDAPSGGGAEKFVVTITDNAGVTSNKTIAEILAAKAAGKEVVAHVTSSTYSNQVVELPLVWSIAYEQGSAVFFSVCAPRLGQTVTEAAYSVYCLAQQGQEEEWISYGVDFGEGVPSYSSFNNGQVLGVSSGSLAWVDANAPLIVTLTAGSTEGQFVGNKTHEEVFNAFVNGHNCVFYAPAVGLAETVKAAEHTSSYAINTNSFTSEGAAGDYITVTVGS